MTYRSFAIMSWASGTTDRGRRIRHQVIGCIESLVSTNADWKTASRLAAVARATSGVTVLACGGYTLQYSSVELRIRMRALDGA
jgi:hypothetical protein